MDVLGSKNRIIIKGISLNTYHYFKDKKFFTDKKIQKNLFFKRRKCNRNWTY